MSAAVPSCIGSSHDCTWLDVTSQSVIARLVEFLLLRTFWGIQYTTTNSLGGNSWLVFFLQTTARQAAQIGGRTISGKKNKQAANERTHMSQVPTNHRPRPEALHRPICSLIPVSEGLRAQPVCGVLADRADEHVAHGCRRHECRRPNFPV